MNKQKRNGTAKKSGRILLIVVTILALFLLVFLIWKLIDRVGSDPQSGGAQPAESGIELPYALEDGQLEVTSVFQYTGDNPDCGDEAGEDIAALAVTNKSGRHLTSAQLLAKLADGTEIRFTVADVPAGQTVWVFAADNSRYDTANPCASIGCDAQFEASTPVLPEQLSVSVEETAVTLTNTSGKDLENLTVDCHCLLNDAYFGGRTYSYAVPSIAAGGSVTIQAEECYLGEAVVVRITQD